MQATENWILDYVTNLSVKLPKIECQIPIGDDAFVFKYPIGNLVITQDTMVKNVHWDTDFSHFGDVGFKSLAVNLSDLASMGARPIGALVSLALERSATQEQVIEFYAGFSALCNRYKVALLGGDVVRSEVMTITVTALGQISEGCKPLSRIGAQNGDLIWVTGTLGMAEEGLEMLLKWKKDNQRDQINKSFEGIWKQCQRHRRPEPRILFGQVLCNLKLATSCIDTSDSIAKSLLILSKTCGISIDLASLRNAAGNRDQDFILRAGEDFELIFTAHQKHSKELKEQAEKNKLELTQIGVCNDKAGKCVLLDETGIEVDIKDHGFQHFG